MLPLRVSCCLHITTGTGPFLYGTSSGVTDGDMGGGGYHFIDPANRGSELTGSSYTVQAGDTLQGIAGQVWGDASLCMIAADAVADLPRLARI